MSKKKLIGTVIGVIAFIALIAGATYAWLVFNATVTNGTYNLGTMNFNLSYTKGTDVANVPVVSSPTTENTATLAVVAKLASGSAPGTLRIYLNTENATSDALLTANALHYTVCKGACTQTDLSQETNTGVVTAKNTATAGDTTGKLLIFTGPLEGPSSTNATYNVYFWLDNVAVDSNVLGSTYSGYISAEATQTDTAP